MHTQEITRQDDLTIYTQMYISGFKLMSLHSEDLMFTVNELEKTVLSLENWKRRLQVENELLRSTVVSLQAEVCGARLAARYLDKELAGR